MFLAPVLELPGEHPTPLHEHIEMPKFHSSEKIHIGEDQVPRDRSFKRLIGITGIKSEFDH